MIGKIFTGKSADMIGLYVIINKYLILGRKYFFCTLLFLLSYSNY